MISPPVSIIVRSSPVQLVSAGPVGWVQLGHDGLCLSRNRWTTRRHDNVKVIFAKALSTSASTFVKVEPRTLEGKQRNAIRVRGRGKRQSIVEVGHKINSLYDAHAPKSTTRAPLDASKAEHSLAQSLRYPTTIGKRATSLAPTISGQDDHWSSRQGASSRRSLRMTCRVEEAARRDHL